MEDGLRMDLSRSDRSQRIGGHPEFIGHLLQGAATGYKEFDGITPELFWIGWFFLALVGFFLVDPSCPSNWGRFEPRFSSPPLIRILCGKP
jgi:hypothetical protein